MKVHNTRNQHGATRCNSPALFPPPENGASGILQNTGTYVYGATRSYILVQEDRPS
jgi:hypothetical protein